jgi:hypothetical protein
MARARVADGGDGRQIWEMAANILNNHSQTVDKGRSSSFAVRIGTNILLQKETEYYVVLQRASELEGINGTQLRQRKMHMRFRASNVKSLYRADSPETRDRVSHPYKITGKITVLCVLIFTFLSGRRENNKIHNSVAVSIPEFNCS